MTKQEYISSMFAYTGLCVIAGVLLLPATALFWWGLFSLLSEHDPAKPGMMISGLIMLIVTFGIAIIGDQLRRKTVSELFPDE